MPCAKRRASQSKDPVFLNRGTGSSGSSHLDALRFSPAVLIPLLVLMPLDSELNQSINQIRIGQA